MRWIQINTSSLRLLSPGARYLIGVSGGRDSIRLLQWRVECGYNKLIVCHLNHRLRGRSSRADAIFVQKLAEKYDVDLALGAIDVRALAVRTKQSIETAAREARYKFFAQVAKRRRCRTIFLGHHADDLVETFLINLFRGAGPGGLSAMHAVSVRKIDNVKLQIVRPLLGVSREQIDDYVRKHRLKFREDASNKNLAPLRNRIRCRVVPYLKKTLGRNIRQSIWRAAMIAAEQENWIENQLPDSNDVDLSVKKLRDLPIALQRRQILNWLRKQTVSGVTFDVIERVRLLLDQQSRVAKINLSRDRHARRRAGKIFIE